MCQSVSLDAECIAGDKCNLLIFRALQEALMNISDLGKIHLYFDSALTIMKHWSCIGVFHDKDL